MSVVFIVLQFAEPKDAKCQRLICRDPRFSVKDRKRNEAIWENRVVWPCVFWRLCSCLLLLRNCVRANKDVMYFWSLCLFLLSFFDVFLHRLKPSTFRPLCLQCLYLPDQLVASVCWKSTPARSTVRRETVRDRDGSTEARAKERAFALQRGCLPSCCELPQKHCSGQSGQRLRVRFDFMPHHLQANDRANTEVFLCELARPESWCLL